MILCEIVCSCWFNDQPGAQCVGDALYKRHPAPSQSVLSVSATPGPQVQMRYTGFCSQLVVIKNHWPHKLQYHTDNQSVCLSGLTRSALSLFPVCLICVCKEQNMSTIMLYSCQSVSKVIELKHDIVRFMKLHFDKAPKLAHSMSWL